MPPYSAFLCILLKILMFITCFFAWIKSINQSIVKFASNDNPRNSRASTLMTGCHSLVVSRSNEHLFFGLDSTTVFLMIYIEEMHHREMYDLYSQFKTKLSFIVLTPGFVTCFLFVRRIGIFFVELAFERGFTLS